MFFRIFKTLKPKWNSCSKNILPRKQQIFLNNENKYYVNAEETRIIQVNILEEDINSICSQNEIWNLCYFVTFKRVDVCKERLFVFVKSLMWNYVE